MQVSLSGFFLSVPAVVTEGGLGVVVVVFS